MILMLKQHRLMKIVKLFDRSISRAHEDDTDENDEYNSTQPPYTATAMQEEDSEDPTFAEWSVKTGLIKDNSSDSETSTENSNSREAEPDAESNITPEEKVDSDVDEAEVTVPTAAQSRPRRETRKPPKHLEDYDTTG